MDFINSRYCKPSRLLLTSLGLWPYKQLKFIQLHRIVHVSILGYFLIVQVSAIFTTKYNISTFGQIITFTLVVFIYIIRYLTFATNLNVMKKLIDKIQCQWDTINSKKETLILLEYANTARIFGIAFILFLYVAALCFVMVRIIPPVLDVLAPLEESRSWNSLVVSEYFIDQRKYIYLIVTHEVMVSYIGITSIGGSETMLITFIHHLCAMLKITSSRIEDVFDKGLLELPAYERRLIIQRRLIDAVHIHRNAIDFSILFSSVVTQFYGFLIIMGVASFTVVLFNLTRLALFGDSLRDLVLLIVLVWIHFLYIYYTNHLGQEIINHNAEVYLKLCQLPWYIFHPTERKLLLFFMLRSTNFHQVTIATLFIPSLEGFTTLTSSTISYFMFVYSMM